MPFAALSAASLMAVIQARPLTGSLSADSLIGIANMGLTFALVALLLLAGLLHGRVKLGLPAVLIGCVLLMSVVRSVAFAADYGYSIVGLLPSISRYVVLLFIPPIVFTVFTGERVPLLRYQRWAYFITLIVSGSLIGAGMSGFGYAVIAGESRLAYPFTNPNVLAAFSHFMVFLSVWLGVRRIIGVRAAFVAAAFFFFVLLRTGSITSLGANLVFLGLFLLSYFSGWRRAAVAVTGLFVVGVLIGLNFELLSSRLVGRLFELDATGGVGLTEGSSILWRFIAWTLYLRILADDGLFFGIGIGSSRVALDEGSYYAQLFDFPAPGTHNDYIMILFDFGVVGVAAMLAVVIAIAVRLLRRCRNDRTAVPLLAFFVSALLAMGFDNYLDSAIGFMALFWICLGLIKGESTSLPEESS